MAETRTPPNITQEATSLGATDLLLVWQDGYLKKMQGAALTATVSATQQEAKNLANFYRGAI